MQEGLAITRARVVAVLRNAPRRGTEIDLVLMALQGKTAGFEKVIKLIQDMVANLKKEQADDDSKKTYCESELDKSEDTGKQLERSIEVSGTAIEELKGAIATWTTEIGDLQASIRDLDSSVAEATKLRKEENSEFKDLMTNNKAAKEVLLWAKNRLNKFYSLYKPEALAQTAPQLVQVSAHRRGGGDAAPPPPPETFGAYVNKGQQTGGVVSMIDMLVGELDKEMSEAEVSEKDAQADYETLMSDAGAKRAADTKAVTDKAAAKAKGEESLQAETDNKKGLSIELMETKQVIANLHAECDWLTTYYDVRRQARTEEIESLGKAEAVLSGADYSLLQTRRAALRGA
ncbi:unnamed protein product [Prorocentrum cordatum]|uniref:Uncharacterized protein n=1 Tax=Prorocentrum cordatum TaxID=2364126 RepID=A0ABN9XJJ5_9DINO|nr:unnamed protein product [Polarella glacialis]